MSICQTLRALLHCPPLVIPDAYDALSARIIENAGFHAVQCSGYSMALARGCKSEMELGLEMNLEITREIVRSVKIPVMADGEDGFGPPETVKATIAAFIESGVAGINIEDQDFYAQEPGKLVEPDEMVEKIAAARSAAAECNVPDFVINGRTDALAVAKDRDKGLSEAIRRSRRYLEAGADLAFITSVATLAEAELLVKEIPGPVSIAIGLPYNLDTLSVDNLRACGVARISFPTVAIFSAIRAVKEAVDSISAPAASKGLRNCLCTREDLARLLR